LRGSRSGASSSNTFPQSSRVLFTFSFTRALRSERSIADRGKGITTAKVRRLFWAVKSVGKNLQALPKVVLFCEFKQPVDLSPSCPGFVVGGLTKTNSIKKMIVRANVIATLFGTFLLVGAAPHGKQDDDEFRDKKYDEEVKHVTKVGNTYVAALEIYDNPPDQDNARKEVDNFPSNIYSKYDGLQHKVKSFFDAEPLIDNIRESDKYGNTGDQFYFITKPLVETTAKVNMFINSVIAAPKKLLSGFQKQANDKLNDVGAALVGLRR
uniref:Uncharacterized protein n=2 Tax=Anopheles atroparvus TaxID=41427 RepID=A0A182JKD7_ANOAO